MGNYVRVPVQDWQSICDGVRFVKGSEEPLKSGEIATYFSPVLHMDAELLAAGGAYPHNSLFVNTVYIPEDATYLALDTFDGMPNVETVYYNGQCEMELYQSYVNKQTVYQNAFTKKPLPLKKLVVGGTVKSLGDYFAPVATLKEVTLEEGLESIGSRAFMDAGIESIVIPDSLKAMGEYAFCDCTSLKSVEFGDGLEAINNGTFHSAGLEGELVLPLTVKTIGGSAFNNCQGITAVVFPAEGGTIRSYAFYGCDNLASVETNAKILENNAFSYCYGLKTVVMPQVENIGNNAFYECGGIESVTLGEKLGSVGDYAFQNCVTAKITGLENLQSIGYRAFYCCQYLTEETDKTLHLKGQGVTIENFAFYGVFGMEHLIIDHPNSIGSNAFDNCSCLKTVVLGEGLINIESGVFGSCYALESITIPASVTYIFDIPDNNGTVIRGYEGSYAQTWVEEQNATGIYNYVFESMGPIPEAEPVEKVLYMDAATLAAGGAYQADATDYTKAVIPADATYVSLNALDELPNVTAVEVNGDCAFETYEVYDSVFKENANVTLFGKEDSNIEELVIKGRTSVEKGFAYMAPALTKVSFEDCGDIGRIAFLGCSRLETVTFTNLRGATIGGYAFYECTSLREVVIPDSVTAIEQCAFAQCTSLESITIPQNCNVQPLGWGGCPDTMVVRGYEGSSAENMANAYGFPFEVIG